MVSRLLRKTYNELAFEGLIGPHNDYETDLLLRGLKPVMILSSAGASSFDLTRLFNAVAAGLVHERTLTPQECPMIPYAEHFFCLPAYREDMNALVEFYRKAWSSNQPPQGFTAEEYEFIGRTLGYSEKDIELFLGNKTRKATAHYTREDIAFLLETNDRRRADRYAILTSSAPCPPVPPAAPDGA